MSRKDSHSNAVNGVVQLIVAPLPSFWGDHVDGLPYPKRFKKVIHEAPQPPH